MKYYITEYTIGSVLTLEDGRRFAFLEPKRQVAKLMEALPWTNSPISPVPRAGVTSTAQTPKHRVNAHPAAGKAARRR